MNILFIGDIVGSQGRAIVQSLLPVYKDKYNIDVVIANAENAAHGKGITPKIATHLFEIGVDVITMGNHSYAKRDVYDIDENAPIVFPGNMSGNLAHKHTYVLEKNGIHLAISNVYGSVFMDNVDHNPFDLMQKILCEVEAHAHIVDFHGEATAEKQAFLHYFKEDVSAIVGTHTHIQTADEDVFDGCAYISDVGMCGPYESILGRDIEEALAKVVENKTTHYKPSKNPAIFNAVVITLDDHYRSSTIKRISVRPTEKAH